MKKEAYYFPHDCNARNDEKILAVRMRHGAEGYGIYFMIIERLRESTNYMSFKDYNLIAFELRVSAEKVKSIIEDFGLFQFSDDGKLFYSESLLGRMNKFDNIKKQRQLAARASASKRAKKGDNSTNAQRMLNECSTNAQQSKVKKSKEDNINIIIDNNVVTTSVESPSPSVEEEDAVPKKNSEILPAKEIKDLWNATCTSFPKLHVLSEARKHKMRVRIEEMGGAGKAMPLIRHVFEKMQASRFLKGDSKDGWKASFDWLFENNKNWVKVHEGNYDDGKGRESHRNGANSNVNDIWV